MIQGIFGHRQLVTQYGNCLLPSASQIFHNSLANRLSHLLLVILLDEKLGFLRVAEKAAFS